ncbi:type II toxin-antitoxin system VapC family toxin [Pyrodictium abyssi]|uniref:Ribonuclease VapC n=1 Tax=Pyrodictium abyssi TaxID=54256 RepID=A0ABM8IWF4_9CREN|nr:type II toxin-antitoxin system VapC family toxin [Pyrodictium abyssi]
MIVIDASALAKYVLHEEGWTRVSWYIRHRRPLASVDHVLKEVGNAIWKRCRLHRAIDAETAARLYRGLRRLAETGVIQLRPEEHYLDRAMELALEHGITLYDALYIALAEEEGELLTGDTRQAEAAARIGIQVHLVA